MNSHPLIFDIETIGDISAESRDEIAALAARRDFTPEAYAALCPPLARVVCVACFDPVAQQLSAVFDATLCPGNVPVTLDVGDRTGTRCPFSCALHRCDGEAALLRTFGLMVEHHLAQPNGQLVTYNGRGFDLPVLIHRSIKHGVAESRTLLVKAMAENRYRPQIHIDLMDVVTFGGASSRWPMSTYAIGYGGKSPKTEMGGAHVSAAVHGGRIIDVVRYCAGDVMATAYIYDRASCLLSSA